MPIYEFVCGSCGKDSEVLVRSSKWKGTQCPHCGSTRLAKKFSVFASSAAESSSDSCCATPSGGKGGGGCCGGCCSGH